MIQLKAHNGADVTVFASFAAHGLSGQPRSTGSTCSATRARSGSTARRSTCTGAEPAQRTGYDLAVEYQGSYNRTIAHFVNALRDGTPFETAPQDNLETLRLVEDCYRLSGWEDVDDEAAAEPSRRCPALSREEEQAEVIRRLEEDIIFGRFAPGSRLVEDTLMARYGASRHFVRQALFQLERQGIVLREKNIGATVRFYSGR